MSAKVDKMKNKEISNLLQMFRKGITDYRTHIGKIKYDLHEILLLTLLAMLKGEKTYADLHDYLLDYKTFFPRLKKLFSTKIPSLSQYHKILVNVNNNEIEAVFREYFLKYRGDEIALDGKFQNGSDINGQYVHEQHKNILNVLDKINKIVIAHSFISNKKSEIPAVQALLAQPFLSAGGQIFSFDALHTQVETLAKITKQASKH
jgi:DDE_Tnp_1-associated